DLKKGAIIGVVEESNTPSGGEPATAKVGGKGEKGPDVGEGDIAVGVKGSVRTRLERPVHEEGADRAIAPQRGPAVNDDCARYGAIDQQPAPVDRRWPGIEVVARQLQRTGPGL